MILLDVSIRLDWIDMRVIRIDSLFLYLVIYPSYLYIDVHLFQEQVRSNTESEM